MTDRTYTCNNVKLIVKDRKKITKLTDEDFNGDLETLAGWETNLYKLYAIDPTEIIALEFPTEQFIEKTKCMTADSNEFIAEFCETMSVLMDAELKRRNIDLNKLHYGIETERGIDYEYSHITEEAYNYLLESNNNLWYKVTCVVLYRQIHKDTFFVPNKKLHEFFAADIYKCYNGEKRKIINIEQITREEAAAELAKIRRTIKENEDKRFRA